MQSCRRVATSGVLAVLLAASMTACSVAGCSGSSRSTAVVSVDATAWIDEHPGHVLSVCLDDVCAAVATKNTLAARTAEPSGHAFVLTATDTSTGAQVGKETSRLFAGSEQTACGDLAYPTGTMQISATGAVSVQR